MSSNHSRHIWIAATFMMLLLVSAPHSFAQTDKVVAKIGNQTVTESDLKEISNAVPEKFRHLYLTPEGRKKTLDYVVNIYVLAAEAERLGMDKKPETDKLLQFTRRDLLARLYLDQMSKDLPAPTDAEAKEFYEANKAQYATPESVHLHHILVSSEKEAKDAMDKLKKGEKFADLASQISICPSKMKGGNLEWLPKGSLVPEIEEVAFSMKNGQITGPVKSKFGYHVLLLEDKKPAQENSFDQVKEYILEQLRFQKQQDHYEKISNDLRKKMQVQINDQNLPSGVPIPAGPTSAPK
ncbi:peptidylprolyl isomerase [Desulfomonile tiedjei]|uniref:peptidylprolyl isomerase n=1 Tax=Desulfomonile tiedjei (strain ATCC 49306 / DSM 6799 / DCB-1) TaxID=706587 RepID=I4C3P0_DESTA|nr:peptidyl-prolyl cis-trans isomerase [Desulfomonile tiedjei]AFM24181.1 parvulin-like peptidyl-prolyl isomerase [Desulfomonile tiedjei DSM 6799]